MISTTSTACSLNFYPRPPHGGRRQHPRSAAADVAISIHALLTEGDVKAKDSGNTILQFLSTPSSRRATRHYFFSRKAADISIHALLTEGDIFHRSTEEVEEAFLSTPSSRRATYAHAHHQQFPAYFYPRPPHGGRPDRRRYFGGHIYFYPRPPHGGRLWDLHCCFFQIHIYPRPPHGGRPCSSKPALYFFHISIHALLTEGDSTLTPSLSATIRFLSTPSSRRAT